MVNLCFESIFNFIYTLNDATRLNCLFEQVEKCVSRKGSDIPRPPEVHHPRGGLLLHDRPLEKLVDPIRLRSEEGSILGKISVARLSGPRRRRNHSQGEKDVKTKSR